MSAAINERALLLLIVLWMHSASAAQVRKDTAKQTPPASLEQKIACADIVKKDEPKVKLEDVTVAVFSRFEPKSAICFEIRDERSKYTDDDGKTYVMEVIRITDAVEKTTYSLGVFSEDITAKGTPPPSLLYGSGFVKDTKGVSVSFGRDIGNARTLSDYWNLVFTKLGIMAP